MKLSTRARYCLRMMVEISRQTKMGNTVSLNEVSISTGISRRYLEQLAITLKNASLIRGITGKAGGYTLTTPSEEIKIGNIIEAAIGPVSIVECVEDPDLCSKSFNCECRLVYSLINKRIQEILNDISLSDLSDRNILEHLLNNFDKSGQAEKTEDYSQTPACLLTTEPEKKKSSARK